MTTSTWITGHASGQSLSQNTTRYFCMAAGPLIADATESNVETLHYTPCTVHTMAWRVPGSFRSAITIRSRRNNANGNQLISVVAGVPGYYEDNNFEHTDHFDVGDTSSYQVVLSSAIGGNATVTAAQVCCDPDDSTLTHVVYCNFNGARNFWGSQYEYKGLSCYSLSQNLVPERAYAGFSAAGEFLNLRAKMTVNSRGGMEVAMYFAGAAARGNMLIDTGTVGSTGWNDDTVNTDPHVAGEEMCFNVGGGNTAGGSNTINIPLVQVDWHSYSDTFHLTYNNPNSIAPTVGPPVYFPLGGGVSQDANATETNVATDINLTGMTVFDLYVNYGDGTPSADETFTIRKAGAGTAVTLTAGTGASGPFWSAAGLKVAFNSADDLTLETDGSGFYTFACRVGTMKVQARKGAYSLSGQTAGLRATRNVSANLGSYTLSGQAVALLLGRRVFADAGSYALTGKDVTFRRTYAVQAENGAYLLDGQSAALLATRRIAANVGAYSVVGQDVTLRVAKTMLADPGAYALTGQDVQLLRDYIFSVEAGHYDLVGKDVNLLYMQQVAAILLYRRRDKHRIIWLE